VHATKIVAAVLDTESGELQFFTLGGDVAQAAGLCARLPRPVRVAYEAGPTGYGLARELANRGVECVVAAPSKIPRASGDRVKTDRRDAEHLVRLLLAGKLHAVRVPGDEEEALASWCAFTLSLRHGDTPVYPVATAPGRCLTDCQPESRRTEDVTLGGWRARFKSSPARLKPGGHSSGCAHRPLPPEPVSQIWDEVGCAK
jgi:hypothetical protein